MLERPQRMQALDVVRDQIASFDWTNLTDGRRLILEAFLRIATTAGYSAVTMRALGRQVNVKAPSLYSHFPGGRDEVVSEALTWHYSQFATGTIQAVESTADAMEFWTTLVDQHVRRQLQTPENDMFDLMLATDRISGFLPPETREEISHLVDLNAGLFKGAALDMGYQGDVDQAVAIVLTVLDGVRSWSRWNGDIAALDGIAEVAIRTSLATLDAHLLSSTK
ncbi:TetR/AcrR family transcriptional regulator [Arthrobacter sp. 2MCAF15]|uniref:TetR/AcrR family transcriptional regulator n=1 Tax=Arthrobacter sp. 2MCAF15 TaxID=3232984 RepID=UPI003F92D582